MPADPQPPPRPIPVRSLKVTSQIRHPITLRNRQVTWEVQALAPDLLRLRVVPGGAIPETPSWAVIRRSWPEPVTRISRQRSQVSLETDVARWTLSLTTGAWDVTDRHGIRVFSAPPGALTLTGSELALNLDLVDGESLFGLGESTGPLNRRGRIRDFWNIDVLGHAPAIHPGLQQLYVSIPFAVTMRDGRAAGLFWDNPARQHWDLGQTRRDRWTLKAASGELDLYLFLGPGIDSVLARYTELTGAMPLPPRWALGYHQSRYSYETQARLEQVAREFRRRQLPCDALYLDIDHLDGYRVFTFGKAFPRPAAMAKRLAGQGFKLVAIVDPGVKDEPAFGVRQRGIAARAFVQDPAGKKDFIGEVWPGKARFPDFLNPRTRKWWGREQAALLKTGVAGIWNDMNEPANFARPDKTLDPNCRHQTDFGPRAHHEVHNVYGQQMAQASREGCLAMGDGGDPSRTPRPFVITRAGYAGIQRHALVWTGDTSSQWEHLNEAVPMLLNLSLSGVPFCGGDVGGFLDNATPELFVRWLQLGTFTPFFRNHTNVGTVAQEPWAFGTAVEDICRNYLNLRYQMLPLLYCLFAEARSTGAPIMRPLLWHYQNDPVAVGCGDQFLLGRDLLVAPILRPGAVARSVYLPNDVWTNFWTGERHSGGTHIIAEAPLGTIPLFVRAGGILPLGPRQQFVGEADERTVLLHCWPGAPGTFSWYEDDGATQAYEQGHCRRRTLHSRTRGRRWTLGISTPVGVGDSSVDTWRIALWGARPSGRLTVNRRPARGQYLEETPVLIAEVPNEDGPIEVAYSRV